MKATVKTTLSVAKADVGGFVGHTFTTPEVLDAARVRLRGAREKGVITDFHVLRCGDDVDVIVSHRLGKTSREVHSLLWEVFCACKDVAKEQKLCLVGHDLVGGPFTGDLSQMGPSLVEMEFEERASEPVLVFFAIRVSAGVWNLPIYRAFGDPFNTCGLLMDPAMFEGFIFEVFDLRDKRGIRLCTPEDTHALLALIGNSSRYVVRTVYRRTDNEACAAIAIRQIDISKGKYIGKCTPIAIVRCQNGFPSIGEVMEPYSLPHLAGGWMWGSHTGPLMPVAFGDATPVRFDGPPRVICAGLQVTNGRLLGPRDMFSDPSFDESRRVSNYITDYMRRHGPFQPHRLPDEEMEYTAMPWILDRLSDRFY